jgi:hypothetical protein
MAHTTESLRRMYDEASEGNRRLMRAAHPDLFGDKPARGTKASGARPGEPASSIRINVFAMTVTLPITTQTESNTAGHWAGKAKRAKAQRAEVRRWLAPAQPLLRHSLPLRVTMTRGYRSRPMDSDNLPTAFKHIRDEIADICGVDDGGDQIEWCVDQVKGRTGVKIRIESAAGRERAP